MVQNKKYENNDYIGFVANLEIDDLAGLGKAISRAGFEGTSLEGKVQNTVVNGRVEVIPRGDEHILLYDHCNQTKVWIKRSTSEAAFKNILNRELLGRIHPFTDVESYYNFKAGTDPN
jgi:hypothetical protein